MKMRSLAFVLAAITGLSFTVPALAATAPTPRCSLYVSTPWARGPTPKLTVEAFSDGPTCAKSVIVYVIRGSSGQILFKESYQSDSVMITQDARTVNQMRAALRAWISTGAGFTNSNLPNWLAGARQPEEREFGFTPHEDITRADYLAIKAGRAPVLCHVAGMESTKCLVWLRGSLQPFGGEAFPG